MFPCAPRGLVDHGVLGIDAAVAVGLASVAAVGLLAAATSMMAQARQAVGRERVRAIAEQVQVAATATGCGLAVGSEDPVWLVDHGARCASSLGLVDAEVIGDLSFVVVRDGVDHEVVVTARWRRSADGAGEAATCAALAAEPPLALERTVSVARAGDGGDPHVVVTAEAVPGDTVAHHPAPGIVVRGLTEGAQVDLVVGVTGGQLRLRKTASIVAGGDGCAWFPFLADTTVELARAGGAATLSVAVAAELVVVDAAVLP